MKVLSFLLFSFLCSCSRQGLLEKDFLWDKVETSSPKLLCNRSDASNIALEITEENFLEELILRDLSENPDFYTEEEILDILFYDSHLQ